MAPNIAIPIVNPIALETLNTGDRNRLRGITGSAARRSCQTNAASRTRPAAPRPRIVVEPHAYWFPPQVATRMRAVTAALSNPAPR